MQPGRPAASSKESTDRGWGQASFSSLRSVGASLASGLRAGYDSLTLDSSDKEPVTTVRFARLEYGTPAHPLTRRALLLGYQNGFQVWELEDARLIRELTSRRDGAVRCLEAVPLPSRGSQHDPLWTNTRPCIAVAPLHAPSSAQEGQAEQEYTSAQKPQWQVQLYSLQSHTYFHSIAVASRVLGLRCSCRILAVALDSQVLGYDVGSLALVFSVMTHPAPGTNMPGGSEDEKAISVPLALGPRWLAYAANQGVQAAAGCAVAQHPGGAHQMHAGAQNGNMAPNYQAMSAFAKSAAKLSSKQLRSFGEASFKYLSSQYDTWRGGNTLPGAPATTPGDAAQAGASDIPGTVMVRDVVSRSVVAHFRAHTSPLHVLDFDPSGTLLVTASVHGHSIHIFQICPPAGGRAGSVSSGIPSMGSAIHLFRLSRGVTPAVIQGLSFSSAGDWLTVSSARGTGHLFHLAAAARSPQSLPAHLAAANAAGGRAGEGSGNLRGMLPPTKLLASGRVRGGGNGLLNGSIPGSAAASAAVSLYGGSSGCPSVASAFMPRRMEDAHEHCSSDCPLEDLLMVSADGLLTRHRLRMASPHQNSGQPGSDGLYSNSQGSAPSGEQAQDSSNEVAAEADAQWDICRRSTWPEREETFETGLNSANGPSTLTPAQERQRWMAQAETWLPSVAATSARPGAFPSLPLWADPQFHLLEMHTARPAPQQPTSAGRADSLASTSETLDFRLTQQGGTDNCQPPVPILQVEEVPTRRVTATKAALAPVMTEPLEAAAVWRGSSAASHRSTPSVTPTHAHMRSGSFGSDASSPACRAFVRNSLDSQRLPRHGSGLGG